MISKEVGRGLLVYPWAAHVDGCPQTDTHAFYGLPIPSTVHVLARPDVKGQQESPLVAR